MSQSFAIGDVVQLKSGGPQMTIDKSYPPNRDRSEALCVCKWFDNGTSKSETFAASALERVPPNRPIKRTGAP